MTSTTNGSTSGAPHPSEAMLRANQRDLQKVDHTFGDPLTMAQPFDLNQAEAEFGDSIYPSMYVGDAVYAAGRTHLRGQNPLTGDGVADAVAETPALVNSIPAAVAKINAPAAAAAGLAVVREHRRKQDAQAALGIPQRNTPTRFIDVSGGHVIDAPITWDTKFPLIMRAFSFIQAMHQGPYRTVSKAATASGGSATLNFAPADFRPTPVILNAHIPCFQIQVAPTELAAIPNATVIIAITAKDLDGLDLTIGPIIINYADQKKTQLVATITPWRLVNDRAFPTLAKLSATSAPFDLSITVTGLQNDAQVTMIVPGTNSALFNDAMGLITNAI